MRAGDEAFEDLRRASEELAHQDVHELVAEARIEARARVRSMLAEAMAQALLDRSHEHLRGELTDASPRAASPAAPPPRAATAPAPARPREAAPPRPAPPPPAGVGWYVYCVVGAEAAGNLPELTGVSADGTPAAVVEGGVAAIASRVPLERFGEEALRENLNDAAWLELVARAHEDVLEALLEETTVVPMRLCTLYSSEQAIREMLRREVPSLTEALQRLAGRSEWGLKLFAVASGSADATSDVPPDEEGPGEAASGAEYMRRRAAAQNRARQADRAVDDCARDVHGRLSAIAEDALVNPLQRREASGHDGEMALNGVYLVDDGALATFHSEIEDLRAHWEPEGFDLVATGPWPPYNFVKSSIEAAR
jgi:hypothetical protein